jgi:hypothetical protein
MGYLARMVETMWDTQSQVEGYLDTKKTGCDNMDCIHLAQDRDW